jgi:chloramphenicol-sensitive protein RarD
MKYLIPASVFLCGDWTLFIWAVSQRHVLDSALGYYFNPLVIFLSGVLLVKEKATCWNTWPWGWPVYGIIISVRNTAPSRRAGAVLRPWTGRCTPP